MKHVLTLIVFMTIHAGLFSQNINDDTSLIARIGDSKTKIMSIMGVPSVLKKNFMQYKMDDGHIYDFILKEGLLVSIKSTLFTNKHSMKSMQELYLSKIREYDSLYGPHNFREQVNLDDAKNYIYWDAPKEYRYMYFADVTLNEEQKERDIILSIGVLENEVVEVTGRNLKEINQYDLPKFVDVFFDDVAERFESRVDTTKYHLFIPNRKSSDFNMSVEFDDEIKVVAIANGYDDDERVEVKINPKRWSEFSAAKKWYIVYHELGHDVLNLKHGHGGRMMYNYSSDDYTWSEFIFDKNYMLDFYIENNKKEVEPAPRRNFFQRLWDKLFNNKNKQDEE